MADHVNTLSRNRIHDEEVPADPVIHDSEEKSPGVLRIEAIVSTFNTFDKYLLYIGLLLAACKSESCDVRSCERMLTNADTRGYVVCGLHN